jgi:hypothetical protein
MFHCAGREPGTGSAEADNAANKTAATVNNVASDDRKTKPLNSAMRIGLMSRFD